jgi:hypothetical protein
MAWSKEEKVRRRAAAAGPHPKPRGRAPKGKTWDQDSGEWIASPSSTKEAFYIGTAAAFTWETPVIFDHAGMDGCLADPLLPGELHENVQVTPRGSRVHLFKHTSPGGTVRQEEYTSPAGGLAMPDQSAEARARRAKCERGFFVPEWTAASSFSMRRSRKKVHRVRCSHCEQWIRIMRDGRMRPHSLYDTMGRRQAEAYKIEHADSLPRKRTGEVMLRCSSSYVYYGPAESDGSDSDSES